MAELQTPIFPGCLAPLTSTPATASGFPYARQEDNRGGLAVAVRSSFVVVANRLPVDEVTGPDGDRQWRPSPGGLVTALHPVLAEHRGTWIGWSGGGGAAAGALLARGHPHPP